MVRSRGEALAAVNVVKLALGSAPASPRVTAGLTRSLTDQLLQEQTLRKAGLGSGRSPPATEELPGQERCRVLGVSEGMQ